MNKTLYYVFDPLCGWCYGAGAAVAALEDVPGLEVELLPSGLFSGEGARSMDDSFAAYAWSNDQRIERLTGQPFSGRYRSKVLADRQQRFDSGTATLALTAVALISPQRELEALKAIQKARYVDGQDITRLETLDAVLRAIGLEQVAARLTQTDDELVAANRARLANAQDLLRQFNARGVPTFILETSGQRQLLHSSTVFPNPQAFIEEFVAA